MLLVDANFGEGDGKAEAGKEQRLFTEGGQGIRWKATGKAEEVGAIQ